ncbi:MAG TPA: hypothetical protein VJW73_03880 [Gemmatimonadaceae bacterium]|nr:hypothetical protein [Gemmatimonadaceae bacterium]
MASLEFSYRSARSAAITFTLVAVILIESAAVHFAVAARRPTLAWVLTLTSLIAVLWLVRDYRAMGVGVVRLADDALELTVGRRFALVIPLAAIERATTPTFRDLPAAGTTQGRDFLNLTKPAAPNVLLVLGAPRRVRIAAGLHRAARRIAFRLDDASSFLDALEERRAAIAGRSA